MEGFWTAEFGSSTGIFGGGVAIFRHGNFGWGRTFLSPAAEMIVALPDHRPVVLLIGRAACADE